MKAMLFTPPGGADALIYGAAPTPEPQAGEVLVRVYATAIIRTELGWFTTGQTRSGAPRPTPVILGHEFSGVIAAVARDVTTVQEGDAVYGLNDWFGQGAQADYCVARAAEVTAKPHTLEHRVAGAVPISALTAWQALFDHARLQRGQRVLIHGGAGGVGSFAVQFAHRQGAEVMATAAAHNLDFVRRLGADKVIDYKVTPFEPVVEKVDVVVDTAGGDLLTRSYAVLKPGGKLISVVSGPDGHGASQHLFFIVKADRQQLRQIGELIGNGQLHVEIDAVFPLAQARHAYERKPIRGKTVLHVVE